jgi:hypothetical protein
MNWKSAGTFIMMVFGRSKGIGDTLLMAVELGMRSNPFGRRVPPIQSPQGCLCFK